VIPVLLPQADQIQVEKVVQETKIQNKMESLVPQKAVLTRQQTHQIQNRRENLIQKSGKKIQIFMAFGGLQDRAKNQNVY
jgi:hypothetical protein